MLPKRIFSSLILIIIAILATMSNWLFALVATLLIFGGLYEFFKMVEKKGFYLYKYLGILVGLSIPLSIYFKFELTKGWELFLIFVALISLLLILFRRQQNTGVVIGISTTLFGIFYVAWFFSFLIKIKLLPNGTSLVVALLMITKSGDIGAYLIGSRIGKTPLISQISPKKSIEGSLGGLLFSILAALASRMFLSFFWAHLLILGLLLGILSQLGDLAESLIKRDCQVKDSGNIFPGMGGVLDLIDSLIFTAPAFYFYISVISRVAG